MPHTEAIRREVEQLELKAIDIEKEIVALVDEMDAVQHEGTSPGGMYHFDVYSLKPNKSQVERLRKLSADYEAWYNSANKLVRMYLPERLEEFKRYYKYIIKNRTGNVWNMGFLRYSTY